ncbi:hypothetical protein AJ79_01532 [Helicocarpus griseus UAMH5409]|uniref:Pentatricopeptide repeat protein n=1 Tax=Helicocarpus griseus UAMH5409 TaxID=1447875 RepID=A0A2B7Y5Z6_9EURO|nr:hypothetical protein AJ79_01532 [Helicocarpus griseus UAMH5409]
MLRCRNICARSTYATGLIGNGPYYSISSRSLGGFLATRAIQNRHEDRVFHTSHKEYSKPSPRSFAPKKDRQIKLGYDYKRKDEELSEADFAADSKSAAGKKSKSDTSRMNKTAINIELKWATDRVVLERRVRQILSSGDFPKAVDLVRAAQSRKYECAGAWNALFDYEMRNDRPVMAFKLYNDMKKRGRKPNQYTYTIMLSGLAHCTSNKAVQIALAVYRSLCSPKSEVQPSIVHHNAILGVCSRHGALDRMWEVVGSLPESGDGAPDPRTFTVILNALQKHVASEIEPLDPRSQADGIAEKKIAVIREGKRIWADVVRRWKMGEVKMDQHLVSAMGHLLVLGPRQRDSFDVFELLHQTMRVPLVEDVKTQLDKLKSYEQNELSKRKKTSELAGDYQENGAGSTETGFLKDKSKPLSLEDERFPEELGPVSEGLMTSPEDEEVPFENHEPFEKPDPRSETEEFMGLFDPVDLSKSTKKARKWRLPSPTNDHLSLLLEACRNLPKGISIGRDYWQHFNSGTEGSPTIEPDSPTYHEYLRLLRIGRSSSDTLDTIKEMIPKRDMVSRKTFVIGMSCCSRDRKNPHAFDTATEMVQLMDTTLPEPVPAILTKYCDLVRYSLGKESIELSTPVLARRSATLSTEQAVFGKRVTDAIDALRPHVDKLVTLLAYNSLKSREKEEQSEEERINAASQRIVEGAWSEFRPYLPPFEDAVIFLKQARQLYDVALREAKLSDEQRVALTAENDRLKTLFGASKSRLSKKTAR